MARSLWARSSVLERRDGGGQRASRASVAGDHGGAIRREAAGRPLQQAIEQGHRIPGEPRLVIAPGMADGPAGAGGMIVVAPEIERVPSRSA